MAIAVANRYARALADVLGPQGDYRRILSELEDFAATYRHSGELRNVFESPAIPLAGRTKVLGAILERMGTAAVTVNFLRVLVANYRMSLIDQVGQAFRKIAHERLGVTEVRIESATTLSPAEREALRGRFADITGRQVELEFQLNPELLGGVLAQIQSTVYDGSVRGNLQRMRQQLVNQ
jgi:F-type H+-transporting ATPase subunit delta